MFSCIACGNEATKPLCPSCASFMRRVEASFTDEALRDQERYPRTVVVVG